MSKEVPSRPTEISEWMWDIICNCWAYEASERWRIDTVVETLDAGPSSDTSARQEEELGAAVD